MVVIHLACLAALYFHHQHHHHSHFFLFFSTIIANLIGLTIVTVFLPRPERSSVALRVALFIEFCRFSRTSSIASFKRKRWLGGSFGSLNRSIKLFQSLVFFPQSFLAIPFHYFILILITIIVNCRINNNIQSNFPTAGFSRTLLRFFLVRKLLPTPRRSASKP